MEQLRPCKWKQIEPNRISFVSVSSTKNSANLSSHAQRSLRRTGRRNSVPAPFNESRKFLSQRATMASSFSVRASARLCMLVVLVLCCTAVFAAGGSVKSSTELLNEALSRKFDALKSRVTAAGATVHPSITLAYSPSTLSNGITATAPINQNEILLEMPNSLALTADAAYESVSVFLTESQAETIFEMQEETCGLVDWMQVVYIALTAIVRDHPVLTHFEHALPSLSEQYDMHEKAAKENGLGREGMVDEPNTCPAYFFPVTEGQSFPQTHHAIWSRMISLYPATCVGLICHPLEHIADVLNSPLLLGSLHQHIRCAFSTREALETVADTLLSPEGGLPIVSYELLLWATSMVLSRQQSLIPSVEAIDADMPQRLAGLLPILDLFNSHPSAVNNSDSRVYHSKFSIVPSEKTKVQPATQAVTQGAFDKGAEIFDLYGGPQPSPNLDLLTFYGFSTFNLPHDSLGLMFSLCMEAPKSADGLVTKRTKSFHSAMGLMEKFFADAPFVVNQHLDTEEKNAYVLASTLSLSPEAATTPTCSKGVTRKILYGQVMPSGVSVTLPILAKLSVATQAQLAERSTVQRILAHGSSVLSHAQEHVALILLLQWLRTFDQAAFSEYLTLKCNEYTNNVKITFPTAAVPTLTTQQQAMISGDIQPLWRRMSATAQSYVLESYQKESSSAHSKAFLFEISFHQALCTMKLNYRKMIVQAAEELLKFL